MKTLRKKFILFAMSAVTVLLLILIVSINGLTQFVISQQSNSMIEMLVNSEGRFGIMDFRLKPKDNGLPFSKPLNMDQMRSARFFIVKISSDGEIEDVNIDEIFSVTEEQAKQYAMKICQRGKTAGRIDTFRYAVKEIDDGKLIFFMDVSQPREIVLLVLAVSVAIAAVSWLIVLVFVFLISGKVVSPIIAGMEKQKRFITDAGHELKTPLAIIQSNNDANALINGENKYNRNIKSQVIRLNELTAQLLTLAKLDEEIQLPLAPLSVSELASEILPAYKDTAENQELTLYYIIEDGITANSNKESLTKLFTILLDNAIKYTTEGGTIRFELKKGSGNSIVTEENTIEPGTAVDPEQLFERFYRGDAARTQQNANSGYGMGLSIARMICENLGGSLTAAYPAADKIRFTAKIKL